MHTLLTRLPYATIFGGVGAFTRDNFEELNGFSNLFFGWGGEDDDLYKRLVFIYNIWNYSLATLTTVSPLYCSELKIVVGKSLDHLN